MPFNVLIQLLQLVRKDMFLMVINVMLVQLLVRLVLLIQQLVPHVLNQQPFIMEMLVEFVTSLVKLVKLELEIKISVLLVFKDFQTMQMLINNVLDVMKDYVVNVVLLTLLYVSNAKVEPL